MSVTAAARAADDERSSPDEPAPCPPGVGRDDSGRILDRLLLALALIAGAAFRILPAWSGVMSGRGAVFLGNDAYYHVRRIQYAASHYPTVLDFDPYVNFPEGAPIYWPHGFDLLLASAARLFLPGGSLETPHRGRRSFRAIAA